MQEIMVGVKFCGKCNPHVDTGAIFNQIKKLAPDNVQFISKDAPGKRWLLVISGCPADCAGRPEGEYKEVAIAGETLNLVPCPKKDLPSEVVKELVTV